MAVVLAFQKNKIEWIDWSIKVHKQHFLQIVVYLFMLALAKLVANFIPIQNISISLIGEYKHPFKYSRKKEILLSACTYIKY